MLGDISRRNMSFFLNNKSHCQIAVLTAILILFSCLAPRTSIAKNEKRQKAVLQLKWHHQFQFAGYYAAFEKNFFKDAGLDVSLLEGGPDIKVQEQVLSGKADFGVLGSELMIFRSQGLPLVALAPVMQHSIRVIIARKDKGIFSPHDLGGRKVMFNRNELPEFEAMFRIEGVDTQKINILNKNETTIQKFISGQIDAMNGSLANQPFLLSLKKVPFTMIRPINYGIDFYGDTLFTTQRHMRKNPEMVNAFMQASFKGWQYAFKNPEETIKIITSRYGTVKTTAHLMFEQEQLKNLIQPDLVEIGHSNFERWRLIRNAYQKLGIIPDTFSLKGFFYTDYVNPGKIWMKRFVWIIGIVFGVSFMVFLWNFQLRKNVRKASEEILEGRERLRTTLNSIGDAVISVDLNSRISTMNPVAERLTGWSFKNAKGRLLSEVFKTIHSKTRKPGENPIQKVLERKQGIIALPDHTTLISLDGTERQISDSGAPITETNGKIRGVVLVFRDMTQEYHKNQQIKENEKKFRNYIHNAPYGIFVISADGCIIEINNTFCRITGYEKAVLTKKTISQIFHEDVVRKIQPTIVDAAKNRHGSTTLNFFDNGGSEHIWTLELVYLGHQHFLGFINDVTREKKAENELEQTNAYLQTLLNTLPDMVWLKDPEGKYLFCNARFEKFFGAPESEIIGKTDYDFLSREKADFFRKKDLDAITKGKANVNEEDVVFADDGHHEYLETIKTPMSGKEKELVGVLGIARNITERIEAEEKRKVLEFQLRHALKMEAVGTIAGGIAHDFNNILGIILGNTELAMDDVPKEEASYFNLKEIKTACLRAGDVVKQLLSFSRKTEDEKKVIEFREILSETISLIRSSVPTSIDINVKIPDNKIQIKADPTQIHQVLINLCTNATHAMEENGGTLTIELSEVLFDNFTVSDFQKIEQGAYAQLTVHDTGHGIDPQIKERIFDPYFTTKGVGKGSGMGLSIVSGIIQNHNGSISVHSNVGKGSTFQILLPLVHGTKVKKEVDEKISPIRGDAHILLVDDEPAITNMGRLILKRLGYHVHIENDPLAALAYFKANQIEINLVITDMTMPRMTGDLLAKELLNINPQLPIILCTGFSNRIDDEKARQIGIKSYLEKPFDVTGLGIAVQKALIKPDTDE